MQAFEARFITDPQGDAQCIEERARHGILTQRRNRREHETAAAGSEIGENCHARTTFRRALDCAQRLVTRTKQRDVLRLLFAQVIKKIGEGALGDVGGRHHHQHRFLERAVKRGEQRGSRRSDRFVCGIRAVAGSQGVEDRREGAL